MSQRSMATKERKILVAVDEGEESAYALSWCLKNVVTENSKDTLVLLYVQPPHVVYSALDGTGYLFSQDIIASMDRYRKEVAETVTDKAKKLCKHLQDVKVVTRVEIGDPRDMICEVAEKMSVDMVVVGSHGYGLIKRAFLGSVSNHCALSWCLKNVVTENSKDTLVLLYVQPPHVVYSALDGTGYLFSQDIIASMDRYRKEVAETVTDKAKKLCKHLQDVKVVTRVEIGDPRDMICEVAEKMSVDMVVVGSHGYGLIKRAFLGSVSNHCAQNCKCPVLIVKRPKNVTTTSTT